MDKLKFETPDMVSGNIDKIAVLFPSAITEMRGEDGEIRRGVNFEVLKQLLSREVVDGNECYEFTWVGKKAAMAEAARPITKTLRPVKEDSRDWDTTENLYIEGDNLEVLKLLQESYLGKVKMIYIDPPYNTGNDFIYADDFMRSQEEENEQMGMYDEDENRLFKNTDTNGRFHSDWCSMIYSRLMLARNLLSEDGVIFVSIDDGEQENLKRILNESFGESNFIATIVRNTNSSKNQSLFVSVSHEYCLIYAKNIETLKTKHAESKWSVPKNMSIFNPSGKQYLRCTKRLDIVVQEGRGQGTIRIPWESAVYGQKLHLHFEGGPNTSVSISTPNAVRPFGGLPVEVKMADAPISWGDPLPPINAEAMHWEAVRKVRYLKKTDK